MPFHIHNVYGYHGEGEVAGERRRGDLIREPSLIEVTVTLTLTSDRQQQPGPGPGPGPGRAKTGIGAFCRSALNGTYHYVPPDQSLTLRTLWGTMTGFNDKKPKHEEGNWSWSWSCTSASACYDVSNKQTNSTCRSI